VSRSTRYGFISTYIFCLLPLYSCTNHHRCCRWFGKQFVEVSESYLEACGATVYFIKSPQARVPEGFSLHSSQCHWQEMEADMPEGDALEDL
jgi:hypothetical protein